MLINSIAKLNYNINLQLKYNTVNNIQIYKMSKNSSTITYMYIFCNKSFYITSYMDSQPSHLKKQVPVIYCINKQYYSAVS